MAGSAHKTYALLRYVPTYWELPAPAIPILIVAGALLVAALGAYGLVTTAGLTLVVRTAYQWNNDAFAILRVTFASLPFVGAHRRLHP